MAAGAMTVNGGRASRARTPDGSDSAAGRRHPRKRDAPLRLSKPQRQHLVAKLIEQHQIHNQAKLVALLAAEGVTATQATVSRDLDEMGAIKVRVQGGESAYALPALPHEQFAPEAHLRRVLGEWVVEVAFSGNMVVLRTPPGSAHVVGSALDRVGVTEILGTVAGDDTLMLVVAEGTPASEVAGRLKALAGL